MESSSQTSGEPNYPVRFSVEYPDRQLNRGTTAFRVFVAIPILIVAASIGGSCSPQHTSWRLVGVTGGVLFLSPLFVILFTGRYPRSLFDFVLGVLRWTRRTNRWLRIHPRHGRVPAVPTQPVMPHRAGPNTRAHREGEGAWHGTGRRSDCGG